MEKTFELDALIANIVTIAAEVGVIAIR